MKKNQLILGVIVLAILAGLAAYAQHRHPFDFHAFGEQFKLANWQSIAIAVGCIYLGYVIRAIRWALLLRPNKKVPVFSLLGTQVIGFTAVALIGRVADLVRPYLVAKKTGLPLSTQIAVYIVERLFDLGSTALIFSSVLAFAPKGSLPHQEIFNKVSMWGLIGTAAGIVFLFAVRLAGDAVAGALEWSFGVFSKKLGQSMGEKVRTFRTGLNTLRNFSDLLVTLTLSLAMWGLITLAYLETARAFVASPQLGGMTLPQVMVLLGSSGVASVFQLPVLGWFTQIGAVEETLRNLYGVAPEQAMACAATLLVVTFLCIVPVGLIWAQFANLNIRKVAAESELAGEVATESLEEQAQKS